MATPRGLPDTPLDRQVFEEAPRFEFFQMVRLLERMYPGQAPVGGSYSPRREAVRFKTVRGLAFPASAIHQLARDAGSDRAPAMSVAFMGLTGPLGVLPYCYTDLVADRSRAGDRTLADFLDLFNHRTISLFYRAWQKHRLAAQAERGEADRLADCLLAFIGLGMEPLQKRHLFPDVAALFFAGPFAQQRRPAITLEAILRDHFRLPVEVMTFVGRWLRLQPGDQSVLGGRHNQLGTSLVIGAKVWDEQGQFRLRLGPLGLGAYLQYQPDEQDFQALSQMTRLFVNGEFDFDVQLVLKAEEVPDCQLSATGAIRPRLGRTAWLKSRPFARDADEAVFAAAS